MVRWVSQLLWQRGQRDQRAIAGFLNPAAYQPTSPFAFGAEMDQAIARLVTAQSQMEKVAIWGDFDADGLTATSVLWEGLGQFFTPPSHLRYYVPNRFTESHGLSRQGLEALAEWGCTLIVTCDTGSTADAELIYAQALGMDVIVTDHHTLPTVRPPVIALINPRQLAAEHPLADLSGVAVAYKLVEALYSRLPDVPEQSLATLLDLVAIGLIADLVALTGDCRYLTQIGLLQLEQQAKQQVRPGVTKLLEFCKRAGDRPSDVAFGIGPRINAVSRIHGDARFGVELLTSRDRAQAEKLAFDAELANTRRKELQATVIKQANEQLAHLDLSTTQVIILSDPQWSPGVLGLVASQIAQTHGRPTILFQTETELQDGAVSLARGSARSVKQIDLYELVKGQSHLLTSFGGHPLAAGLALPVANLALFTEGINRALRSQIAFLDLSQRPPLAIDLEVTVADLGKDLFRALKLLEPYGMGNPVPRLLLRDVWITNVKDFALKDRRGRKQRYHKVMFDLGDRALQASFPGHWWGHRRDELPEGQYDIVIELDVNVYKKRYEARLIDVCPVGIAADSEPSWVEQTSEAIQHVDISSIPALALSPATSVAPELLWQQWVGMAKYLARSGERKLIATLGAKLGMGDRTCQIGFRCLERLGFQTQIEGDHVSIAQIPSQLPPGDYDAIAQMFLQAVREEQFQRHYRDEVAASPPVAS